MRKSRGKERKVTRKNAREPRGEEKLTLSWPMEELLSEVNGQIEAFSAQVGMRIMHAVMEHEVGKIVGEWGRQSAYRHGNQPGYVVYGGRKVSIARPRVRGRNGGEVGLDTYRAFQGDDKMQSSVARQLTRRCSTRDYAGAIDECLDGYGISRSSVSRQWKAATEKEVQKLCQRPMPEGLVALLLDGVRVKEDCIVVALGITVDGHKQVLGLWHGATENSTVAKALLEDLMERGLDPNRPMLFVIDGSKALRKAIREVFGASAPVQRCRVHKQRNIVEHLPKNKQQQAIWRLRTAWEKSNPREAEAELREIGRLAREYQPASGPQSRRGPAGDPHPAKVGGQRAATQKPLFNEPDRELLLAQRRMVLANENLGGPKMLIRWTAQFQLKMGQAPDYELRLKIEYSKATATKPTKLAPPKSDTIPVILPTTSPGRNAAAVPKST